MIPQYISNAIEQAHAERRHSVRNNRPVSPGDIRNLSTGLIDRLILILKVSSESNTSEFTLLHSYSELATDHDIIVRPDSTGLPYEIVIQTDLRAAISTAELGQLVALVPAQFVSASLEGWASFEKLAMSAGQPLLGPLDARWDFKAEEGETIREISASAIASFDQAKTQWIFEFDEIFDALFLPVDDAHAMALAMYELWITRGDSLSITAEHLELFDDRGLLSREIWSGALGESGINFFDSVMREFIERAMSSFGTPAKMPEESIGLNELRELQNA
jgi:hypothetical protein